MNNASSPIREWVERFDREHPNIAAKIEDARRRFSRPREQPVVLEVEAYPMPAVTRQVEESDVETQT